MGNPSAAQEPSMEEILASIRQIISEDGDQSQDDSASSGAEDPSDALGRVAEADEGSSEVQQASDDGIAPEVTASENSSPAAAAPVSAPESPQPQPQSSQPIARAPAEPPVGRQSAAGPQHQALPQAPAGAKPAIQPAAQPKPATGTGATLPASMMAGADTQRLLSPNADASVSGAFSALAHTILAQNARTLEDLVSEMLRPMLKDWLDDNLPPLVERLVKEEIERVSRGRR